MKFIGEIIELKQRKTVSNDKEFTIKFRTEDHSVLALGAYPADELVQVEVKGEKE